MATWEKLNALALADQLQPVISVVDSVGSGLSAVNDTFSAAITGLSAFTETYADPTAGVTQAIITEIENLVSDFAQIGGASLVLYPRVPDKPIGWTKWRQMVIDSFFDSGDEGRPTYSDAAICGGMVLIGAAPSFVEFLEALKPLAVLFDWQDVQEKLARILAAPPPGPTAPASKPEDWNPFFARQFTPVADSEDYLLELLNSVRFTVNKGKSVYDLFADSASRTLQKLQNINQKLQDSITTFTSDLENADIYKLVVNEQVGGVDYFIQTFQTAAAPPVISDSAYVGGIVICGGSGTLTGLQAII